MTLLKPNLSRDYPKAHRAQGAYVYGDDGSEWLDAASGAIACTIGHGHPHVVQAIAEQAQACSFAYRTQFANDPAERLAQRLCSGLGYEAAFFVNSGSEAVEAATRTALQFWRERGRPEKVKVLSRRLSYHGSTAGSLALSGHWPRRRDAGPLFGEPTLPTPYCFRCPMGNNPVSCKLQCVQEIERQIVQNGAESIAAIIIEPITGASGAAILPPKGYLEKVRDICDRHDVLLIADEVLTGLGRTGKWLAMQHADVSADIVCLGKGLNAGYLPISGILLSKQVYEAIRFGSARYSLGHTHSNHPVAAAAANAVLDILVAENLPARAESMGRLLQTRLEELATDHAIVGDVRGTGMLWGLELVSNPITYDPFPAQLMAAERLVANAFELGLIIYPSSGFADKLGGDAVIIAPPLNISEDVLDAIVHRLGAALTQTGRELYGL